MLSVPKAAEPLIAAFSIAFSRPTFQRVLVLILGAILSLRRRTVTAMLQAAGPLARGHWSDFHRVLCRASWSLWLLGKLLAALILERIPKHQPVVIPVDDTAVPHKGQRVWGKGPHHDAVRSTHRQVVWLWGHKWVTLAINVKFPFASRPWALPVLSALYRPEELNQAEGRRHKTPTRLARQLIGTLIHWFPERKFILVGDGARGPGLAGVARDARRGLVCLAVLLFSAAPHACKRSSPAAPAAPESPPAKLAAGPDGLRDQIQRLDAKIRANPGEPDSCITHGVLRRELAWYELPSGQSQLYKLALEDFRRAHELAGGRWPLDVARDSAGRPSAAARESAGSPWRCFERRPVGTRTIPRCASSLRGWLA